MSKNHFYRGVKISTGDYVIFMNVGDVFSEPTIISKLVQKSFDYDMVYGNHYFIRKNKVKLIMSTEISKITEDSMICHQASMTKRKLLIDSPFDESITIAADYDFFLKQYINGMRFKYVNIGVVYYDVTGLSSNVFLTRKEHEKIRKKYGVISAKKEFINFMKWRTHDIFRLLVPRKIKDILYHQKQIIGIRVSSVKR